MKKIPIGIDDFKKIRENNYYYIDKTNFIEEIGKIQERLYYLQDLEDLEKH